MKKGYVCKCSKCNFMTNEKNKICPLCGSMMEEVMHEEIKINPNLPEIIDNNNKNREVQMGYYCFKHREKMKTRVCINCNNIGSLYIEYKGKMAIIKRINCLTDVFSEDEVMEILSQLTDEEKMYIYYNYEQAYRFFYKKDKPKAIVCFIFSVIFYFLFLDIFFNMTGKEFFVPAYIFNMIGNIMLTSLIILGIWYLIDATNVEFKKVPAKVLATVSIPNLIHLALVIILDLEIKWVLISGYIAMVLGALVYVLYLLWEIKHEKQK